MTNTPLHRSGYYRNLSVESLEPRRLLSHVMFAINAGGHTHVDGGVTLLSDRNFAGGGTGTGPRPAHGTHDPIRYTTFRQGSTFIYSRAVPNGTYTLELSFADPVFTTIGHRAMNVTAEDQMILSRFDIVAAAGKRGAITRVFTVTVADGRLSLGFVGVKGKALIDAIEVIRGKSDVSQTWLTEASAPLARYEAAGEVVNDKLYVFGGYKNKKIQATARSDMFDPASDSWTRLPDMPEELTHAGQAVHGTTIWLVGGFVGNNPGPGTTHVWKFNTINNTWSRGPNLPAARGAGACAIVGDVLHFFGGLDHANSIANPVKVDYADHWTLDLKNGGGWQRAASLPNARNHLAGVAIGGFVYAIGGQHLWNEDHPLAEVDRYDPVTDTWKKVASLPKPRSHMSASTFTVGSKIYVVGGATTGFTSLSDIDAYNPATNKWSHIAKLPSPRLTPIAGIADGALIATTGSQFDLQADSTTFSEITID